MSMSNLPDWYVSQLPSLDDCGPACVTMALNFLGYTGNIKHAKQYFDGAWTEQHIVKYLRSIQGVNVDIMQNPVFSPVCINIVMSTYFGIPHWIVQCGEQYCPIDGHTSGKAQIKGTRAIVVRKAYNQTN